MAWRRLLRQRGGLEWRALMDAGVQERDSLVGFSVGGGEVACLLTEHGKDRANKAVLASSFVLHVREHAPAC